MPAATEASYSKLTLFFSARIESRLPCLAIKDLFAVIKCYLFFKVVKAIFFDNPSDPPINSTTMSIFELSAI